jgi:hypothetical protein
MRVLFLLFFLFSCSEDSSTSQGENTQEVEKISLNGASYIIHKNNNPDKNISFSAFSDERGINTNIVGMTSNLDIVPIDIITTNMESSEELVIERIVHVNNELGYANINNQNYIFNLGNGEATIFNYGINIANVSFNSTPIKKHGDYFYFASPSGVSKTILTENGFQEPEFINSAYDLELNLYGIIHYRGPQTYTLVDLNGVLNNGEEFVIREGESINGRHYSSISGQVFLHKNNPSFLILNAGGNLVERHTFTDNGVEVEEITNTRYFRLHQMAHQFNNNRKYCKDVESSSNQALFCYISREDYIKEVGSDYGLIVGGLGSLFIDGEITAVINFHESLEFSRTSACELYGDCGANNNHTYFGFYDMDAFDIWGNYFVGCGEEMVEYTSPPELLGKRCILYDVRTRKLKSELNEIVDNNTFTVDHVLFEDDGDILFYGSDFGATEKKFKLSTHNAGTWSALQDTVVDFDQYIDKILRF